MTKPVDTPATASPREPREQLQGWYRNTHPGRRLRRQLEADLRVLLDEWFGYHMLVIGSDPDIEIGDLTRVQHITRISPVPVTSQDGMAAMVARDEELPVATDSVDVVVMFHALELSEEPHQLLREVHRVLTPHGHLLIVGKNSLSPLGLWQRLIGRFRAQRAAPRRSLSTAKLEDWLRLLGFASAPIRHKLVLPIGGGGRLGRWLAGVDNWLVEHNLPPGSAFVLYANKTVHGHISGLKAQRTSARLMGLPAMKPVVGARGSSAPRSARDHLRSID